MKLTLIPILALGLTGLTAAAPQSGGSRIRRPPTPYDHSDKHPDYDLHVLAKRDEDDPDVDFDIGVKRRFDDKHVDYDLHVLAKRGELAEPHHPRRSYHRRNLPEFPGRSKNQRHHIRNAESGNSSQDEGHEQQVRGRRMVQSSEELNDYDHIYESRNPMVESRSLQRQ